MSEGRKRSRKSKLEVRDDDCEYEVVNEQNETTSHMQNIPKLAETEYLEVPLLNNDHDYCSIHKTYPKSQRLTESVNTENLTVALPILVKVEPRKTKMASNKRKRFENSKTPDPNTIKLCKYVPDILYSISKEISSSSDSIADKILDIEMRNLWGNVLYVQNVANKHENLLQTTLELWQVWYSASRQVRDCPLFYQCHICNLAWWRLQPFRDHIKTHDVKTLKLSLKENVHECMLIASTGPVDKLVFIDINEDCWKCGKGLDFHKSSAKGYHCSRCKKSLYTCSSLIEHESVCLYSNYTSFNIAKERQCVICKHFLDSIQDVDKHMIEAHSVRSDLLSPANCKLCAYCNSSYFTFNRHNCSRSSKNSSCDFCIRKYATKPLAVAHMTSAHNGMIECRICSKPISKKCQEMEHMVFEHSDNYQLAYKCTICSDQENLYLDEMSIKTHRQLWHHMKVDKRRSYFEMMLVPKLCLMVCDTEEITLQTETETESNRGLPSILDIYHDDQETTEAAANILADVQVTVDEVDIKKEPLEYKENGEIDYEEMLHNMFNQDECKTEKDNEKEFLDNVVVKEEIEVTDNIVDSVVVKSEPIDDYEYQNETVENEYQNAVEHQYQENMTDNQILQNQEYENVSIKEEPETLIVKIESDIDIDNITEDNIVIKNEISDESEVINSIIGLTKSQKSHKIAKTKKSWRNTDEISLTIVNRRKVSKKKKVYSCRKCGYTAPHKKYKLHIDSKCTVSLRNRSYVCTKCDLNFGIFSDYVLHFNSHGYEAMTCIKCGETFDVLVKLMSHMHRHIKTSFVGIHVLDKGGMESRKYIKDIKCQECGVVVSRGDMFLHWEAHVSLKPNSQATIPIEEPPEFTIDCERVTMNSKTLGPSALKLALDHLQATCSTEKECVVCYRAFARRYDLKRHIVEHLLMDAHINKPDNKGFMCQICGARWARQEQYKFHMREHGAMPIFKCELCNKTFSDSSNFAKHKKTHNVRVLVCDMCNKKFHQRSALIKHIQDHSKLGPIPCAFCDQTFVSKKRYKLHKYRMHVTKKFKCVLCDVSFISLRQKWDHNWEVHKERKCKADCPVCSKSFRKFQDVRIHARSEHKVEVTSMKQVIRGNVNMCPVKSEGDSMLPNHQGSERQLSFEGDQKVKEPECDGHGQGQVRAQGRGEGQAARKQVKKRALRVKAS